VRATSVGGSERGYDAGKRTFGESGTMAWRASRRDFRSSLVAG
jgi:hypothetical protein